jgi:hypothetical protein
MTTPLTFSDLEVPLDQIETTKSTGRFAKTIQFPCAKCAGQGTVSGGYINRWSGTCFACNGKGYFMTSAADREAARGKRIIKKEKVQAKNVDNTKTQIVDAIGEAGYAWLVGATWSEFYQELLGKAKQYGELSERQLAAVVSGYAKQQERDAVRTAERTERAASAPSIELARIRALLDSALSNGIKKPILRCGDLAISIAPATGTNAGCLYVKDAGNYAGKITSEGKFLAIREARADISTELQVLAADPMAALSAHGHRTGQCSCCGRTLTEATSVKLGIGPICREKWGI